MQKNWAKFGDSADDRPSRNLATTVEAEEVFMQFIYNKEEENKVEEDIFDKIKNLGDKGVKCRHCNGDHWTSKCSYKYIALNVPEKLLDRKEPLIIPSVCGAMAMLKPRGSNYVLSSTRNGDNKRGDAMQMEQRGYAAIRISNLPENTTNADLDELIKPFGRTVKQYLAKEKQTGLCKGFAYVHFKYKEDAAKAIAALDGYGYDHLILSVEWSRP